ncbi:MAG: alpha/beta fold hydrolase [Ktedonobacteraceae bacterium]
MDKKMKRLLSALGISALALGAAAFFVALWHRLETPQLQESVLPGDAHLYRWRLGHISYKTLGDPAAPALALLHTPALGASSHEMRKIAGTLAQHYHVYALDLPGFGLSDRPAIDYSAQIYSDMLRDFLAEVIGQPVTLLASGLSCNYAVVVAANNPDLCARLVLISPYALSGAARVPDALGRLVVLPALAFVLYPLLCGRQALRGLLAARHHLNVRAVAVSDIDQLYATTHQFGAEHAPLALIAGRLDSDAAREFAALTQPTLIMWGARAFQDALPAAGEQHIPTLAQFVFVPEAGLFVHEEAPAEVVAHIEAWNKAQTAATAGSSVANDAVAQPALDIYCVKCRAKRAVAHPHAVTLSNGRPAFSGPCPVCGTMLYRMRQRQTS